MRRTCNDATHLVLRSGCGRLGDAGWVEGGQLRFHLGQPLLQPSLSGFQPSPAGVVVLFPAGAPAHTAAAPGHRAMAMTAHAAEGGLTARAGCSDQVFVRMAMTFLSMHHGFHLLDERFLMRRNKIIPEIEYSGVKK